jgi:Mrp family chromosome partitioning ATPase
MSKRTGRYGGAPPETAKAVFGERRGAPLPLLTQPMVAIEVRNERAELSDRNDGNDRIAGNGNGGGGEHGDKFDAGQTRIDGPLATVKAEPPVKAEPLLKIDPSVILHGKPTVMMAPQTKGGGGMVAPPQVDLTQHHLPDDELDPRLAMVIDPDSERSAAFRVLRHHLLEVGRPQVVIVSSPQSGDGKTTAAINLALALAECGRAKTLLVETNVRRPQFTNIFKFVPPWCFAEQLAAHRHQPAMPWSLVDIPQLWLHIAAIHPRISQTQLLDGPAFAIAMERLRLAGYDHIVVDAPPVLGSADVNLMADAADSVVFALRSRRSTIRDLRRAIEQLGASKISGTVLLQDA